MPTSQQPSSDGTGQLIDLGSDISAAPPSESQVGGDTSNDLMAQFAQLGITTTSVPPAAATTTTNGVQQQSVQGDQGQEQGLDEFDMFAQSRTAYGTNNQG